MTGITSLFEPEELFGAFWHRLIGETGSEQRYPESGVSLEEVRRRLEIFFRGLGGDPGVEIKAISPQSVDYRQKFLAKIGHGSTAVSQARFDGDHLFLPERIELLDDRQLNEDLYKWLCAWAAIIGDDCPNVTDDPLQNDIAFLRFVNTNAQKVFEHFPGMKAVYQQIAPILLSTRQDRSLPAHETAIELCIRALIAGQEPTSGTNGIWQAIAQETPDTTSFKAHAGYKTFLPFALWGQITPIPARQPKGEGWQEQSLSEASKTDDERTRKAKRQKSDQVDNKNSLVLHRFESILSWAEMMNIPRAVEDDEEDNAKKAADDQEELGLAQTARKASTKLKFDLDLSPQDVEHDAIADKHTYPEWDYRKKIYYNDHCRVLAGMAPELEEGMVWQPDKAARRRIRAVKRQFEALRPRREKFLRQIDGTEIDMDALIRARCDFAANGEDSSCIFTNTRETARDLSVSVLVDISRSSESWIDGRQVIEISREALMALAIGLTASGDDNAIYSFSSLKRQRVNVSTLKSFDEPLGPRVFSRIGALRPGFYTRLGAAIRHVGADLTKTATTKKLLLVLTDGKPNDLDHYEGRYGIEDTAMAVREVRRSGSAVFGITIDKKAQSYFPYIFGRNAHFITSKASDLTRALPLMYRHLVT